jgi:hypothetical protein
LAHLGGRERGESEQLAHRTCRPGAANAESENGTDLGIERAVEPNDTAVRRGGRSDAHAFNLADVVAVP